MRSSLLAGLCLVLSACPNPSGVAGPAGPQGDPGATGATGPTGPAGPQGTPGLAGATGLTGPQGTQGVAGPQGVQGPAGAVLVIDGGIVVGPPGASVVVTPIAPGGSVCPSGGARLTQLSDGGITNVCNGVNGTNGAPGAAGAQGPAGATGPTGPTGPTGATGAIGPTGSPGAAGSAGAQGPSGPQGPPGAPGQVLYLDGGTLSTTWVQFIGFTTATFTGNLGGHPGANLKCEAEFASSFFCTASDYYRAEPSVNPPASGAWIDYERDAMGNRNSSACYQSSVAPSGPWTNSTNTDYAAYVNSTGYVVNGDNCNLVKPLACCEAR